jgi:hypothetical protein
VDARVIGGTNQQVKGWPTFVAAVMLELQRLHGTIPDGPIVLCSFSWRRWRISNILFFNLGHALLKYLDVPLQ